jgi:KaiC/GvpD/RAD55 family RecA-like ATPase
MKKNKIFKGQIFIKKLDKMEDTITTQDGQVDMITTEQPNVATSTEINEQSQPKNSLIRRAETLGAVIEFYANTTPPPILIRGIKVGSIGFVFGVPKSGKTTYVEHLLLSIAAGRTDFNGYPLNCPNRVCLFVSFEENAWGRLERNQLQLNDFTEDEQKSIKENYIVSNQDMPRFVLASKDWKALEDEIAYYKPGILVIDSVSRLTLEDNGNEEVAKLIMKKLREICVQYDCTVIIINHTPKGVTEKQLSIASMSGSRIFMQEADFLIGINRTISNSRYVKLVCARYDKDDYDTVDAFVLNENQCIEITGQVFETEIMSENDGRVDNGNSDAILEEMQKVAEGKKTDIVDVDDLKHLHETGTMSKQTFYKSVSKLIDKGKVKRVMNSKGKYQILGA